MLFATTLFISGCAVGPRYKPPAALVPQQWSASGAGEAVTGEPSQEWWKSFDDPEFEKLIRQAVEANLDLRLAAARVAEARAAAGISKSALLPSIGAAAAATRNSQNVIVPLSGSVGKVPVDFNNFQSSFDASWEVDLFGRLRNGWRAAAADAAAANEARRDVLVTVLGEVGRSYAELRGFQLRLEI